MNYDKNTIFDTKKLNDISRSLSYFLRHNPQDIDIVLSIDGYTDVDVLLSRLNITLPELDWIVANNSKKRFAYNSDKTAIRATQGHSGDIRIVYPEITSNIALYHGTSSDNDISIMSKGLDKGERTHVHLSGDIPTAINVGKRKGSDISIFVIDTEAMLNDKEKIYIAENGVYLADYVAPKYLKKLQDYDIYN